MKAPIPFLIILLLAMLTPAGPALRAQPLYQAPEGARTRWISFESPTGAPGQGGLENEGAKGHAFDTMEPGGTLVLADIEGAGILQRMWITVGDRSPERLRALRLRMYWDGAEEPAVDVPFGDFFGVGLGRTAVLENAFFANPEGRSFVFYIPMPFRRGARVLLTNESEEPMAHVFYDLNYTAVDSLPDDALYFHAHWRRERPTTLGEDFEILPHVEGRGRYLGTNVGVVTAAEYAETWWGEGEVKVYLDDDGAHPTLVGTGTEDYIGTGWGQGAFVQQYQGAPIADPENRRWAFYRYHVPDPVFFETACRVTLQQIGGANTKRLGELLAAGARLRPITIDGGGRHRFHKLLETPIDPLADDAPQGWVNFYRSDDVSATAYFYLDRPTSGLPPLAPVEERTAAVEE